MLSIVTVVRNDRDGLMRTHLSLQMQLRRDWEWIIIDGASTDGTREIVLTLIERNEASGVSERDHGIYDAMNKGLARAQRDYVMFLNAGDQLADAESLVRALSAIEREPSDNRPDIAFFASKMAFGQRCIARPVKSPDYLWHGQPGLHQATLFHRLLHQATPFSDRWRVCGDYDVLARLSAAGAKMKSYPFTLSINTFEAGAMSGRNKLLLLREAAAIQRAELGLSWPRIVISLARRAATSAVFKLLTFRHRKAS